MLNDTIKVINNSFKEFQGNGMYVALFFVAMLYLFLNEKDKVKRAIFIYFPLLSFTVTLNPLFYKAVNFVFDSNVYWRVFWMLPMTTTIGYVSVLLINNSKEKVEKIIITISVFAIIMISGKFAFDKDSYQIVGNAYKLPDESVLVAQLIAVDKEEHKKAIVPETLVGHIRQIDSSIELLYERNPEGYANHPIVTELINGNVWFITSLAKEQDCNYIVFKKATVLREPVENYGYYKFNETQNYAIYKLEK